MRNLTVTSSRGYRRHTFQGNNVFLMEVFRQFNDVLGVRTADYETGVEGIHFAIDSYVQNARKNTATIEILNVEATGHTIAADVKITNLTGTRLPSGVGFRRVWIEFLLIDGTTGRGAGDLGLGADECGGRDRGQRRQGAAHGVFRARRARRRRQAGLPPAPPPDRIPCAGADL